MAEALKVQIGSKFETLDGHTVMLTAYVVRLDWIFDPHGKIRRVVREFHAAVLDSTARGALEWPPTHGSKITPALVAYDTRGQFVSGQLPEDLIGEAAPFGQAEEYISTYLESEGRDPLVVFSRKAHPMDIDLNFPKAEGPR